MIVTPVVLNDLDTNAYNLLILRCMTKVDAIMDDVASIVEDVRDSGDLAILKYTRRFDNVELSATQLLVTQDEVEKAYDRKITSGFSETIESLNQLLNNLRRFHEVQLEKQFASFTMDNGGWKLGRAYRPISKVGVYAPNGTTSYPSTVLMAVTPAKIAGVSEVIVTTKPNTDGSIDDWILIACDIAGVDRIFKVGGVQAIGALALGTETIPRVYKIVGPGNIFVTAAKIYVQAKGYCDIDFPAGPSEILIIADETANANIIAWDMLAQAEHDENACAILVTTSAQLAQEVSNALENALSECEDRKDIKEKALKNYGSILIANSLDEAIAFSNDFAPEHLAIMVADKETVLGKIQNAGMVCLGEASPVAASDYISGVNHILPTGGWAKTYSGLSVGTFLKATTFQDIPLEELEHMMPHIANLARAENLFDAHGKSIEKRFKPLS